MAVSSLMLVLPVSLVIAVQGPGWALDSESGETMRASVTQSTAVSRPGRIVGSDTDPPVSSPLQPAPAHHTVAGDAAGAPAGAEPGAGNEYHPLWERLQRLPASSKANAVIAIEPFSDISPELKTRIDQLEARWDAGRHAEAIASLRAIEEADPQLQLAIGIDWRQPIASGPADWGDDIQISDRWYVDKVDFDFDAETGHLFAVIATVEGDYHYWSVHISTDQGASWSETYAWWTSVSIIDLSCAVVADYLYVAYATTGSPKLGRLRRCFVADGSVDTVYDFHVVVDHGSDIVEFVIATNADVTDNRIYGVDNASYGLDASFNEDRLQYFLVASYKDVTEFIHVARRASDLWGDDITLPGAETGETKIAAYAQRIMVAYWIDFDDDIRYYVSYDEGDRWFSGAVAAGAGVYASPALTGRRGGGFRVVYIEAVGHPEICWTRHRDYGTGPGTAPWSDPELFNEVDASSGNPTATEWIPPTSGSGHAHGAVWIGIPRYAWFDRTDPATVAVDDPVAAPPSAAAPVLTAWPVPFSSGSLAISFTAGAGHGETILSLHDVNGRLVSKLLQRHLPSGPRLLHWDGRDALGAAVPAGTYFLCVRNGGSQVTRKVQIVR
jgi:hypothetical protein